MTAAARGSPRERCVFCGAEDPGVTIGRDQPRRGVVLAERVDVVRFVPARPRARSLIDEAGGRVLETGRFRVTVGGSQPDPRSVALTGRAPLAANLEVTGERLALPY